MLTFLKTVFQSFFWSHWLIHSYKKLLQLLTASLTPTPHLLQPTHQTTKARWMTITPRQTATQPYSVIGVLWVVWGVAVFWERPKASASTARSWWCSQSHYFSLSILCLGLLLPPSSDSEQQDLLSFCLLPPSFLVLEFFTIIRPPSTCSSCWFLADGGGRGNWTVELLPLCRWGGMCLSRSFCSFLEQNLLYRQW